MRMRTVRESHKELRTADPKCALGLSGLYKLVSEGSIPSVRVGQKYLLDLDYLEAYLSGKVSAETAGR